MHPLSMLILGIAMTSQVMAGESVQPPTTVSTTRVDIPAGAFTPLYTTDKTPRKVAAFQLDTTPVTKKQFLEFVTENPRWRRSQVSKLFADDSYLKNWKSDLDPGDDLDSPVTYVSWFSARAYAKAHGLRLPTVDEWEYVACADATRADASTDQAYTQVILDWYSRPSPTPLPAPHTFSKNYYGIRAMHGLIWEWNEDFNNAMVTGESRGDSGLERKLFCAGGALSATDVSNYAAFMRYAFRSSLKGHYTTANLGFRCAKSPENPNQVAPKP